MSRVGIVCTVMTVTLLSNACSESASELSTSLQPPSTSSATTLVDEVPSSSTPVVTTTSVSASSSSQPSTPMTVLAPIGSLAVGLFCRDVAVLGYSYADAVTYWTREGQPDRMDADGNGIPCETVYDHAAVVAFWGDPLPTTTSTTIDVWYSVATPDYRVASLPGAGGHYGSGCLPGSDTLPDGVWFGRVTTVEESKVAFDLMCFGPGPEGPGDITNSNPKLRTVPVDPVAVVHVIHVATDRLGWHAVQYSTWLTSPASPLCVDGCMHWLYVNNGVITEAVELWFA
jgi:hypothetical protein